MSVLVTVAVVLLVAVWGLAVYNRLVRLRNGVKNGWRQVDVQLKRRHERIPDLVAAMKAAMSVEPGALEAVVTARQRASAASGPRAAATREVELSSTVAHVITAVVEGYPDLSQNVRSWQAEFTTMEQTIAAAGTTYNEAATAYNTAIGVMPHTIVAGLAGFRRAELFNPSNHLS